MIALNLFDSNFPHQACSVANQVPRRFQYVRNQMEWNGITLFTDGQMFSSAPYVNSRFTIGWLHEGRSLHSENYERSWDVRHLFDAILTNDAELLAADSNIYRLCIRGGSWIPLDQWGLPPKTKRVSMILSDKMTTEGHRLRHEIARTVPGIDLFGPGFHEIGTNKALALADYQYHIVVEAERRDHFFSEHLIDALALGCIPVYWGCPNIDQYFDLQAFCGFESLAGLVALIELIDTLPVHADATAQNQAQAHQYAITEEWMLDHCLADFVEAL